MTDFKGEFRIPYYEETREVADMRSHELRVKFLQEVDRLLKSGAVDLYDHSRGLLFGVALENIADAFLRGERNSSDYRNLKRF